MCSSDLFRGRAVTVQDLFEAVGQYSVGKVSLEDLDEPALKRIREEALKALATPAVRDRLMAVGLNVNVQNPPTPEQMSKSLVEDYESVGAMLKSVNYKPE
mgnify:CR=1 FL=1